MPVSDSEQNITFQKRMNKKLVRDSRWERAVYTGWAILLALLLVVFHFAAIDGAFNVTGLTDWTRSSRVFIGIIIGVPTLLIDVWIWRWFITSYREYRWANDPTSSDDSR
jgi:hypothetical protein